MEICRAGVEQLPEILKIYENARRFMRENGNREQWQGGYPGEALLRADIEKGQLYLCMEGDEILGVFCYFEGVDPTYVRI